jgi:hypothetical protein
MRMKFLLFSLLLSASAFCQTRKINAESVIQNVTVFPSGARVERSSTVSIPIGRTEISFTGLSNQLEQQTVQLKADANLTLLSVQSNKDFLSARKIDQEERSFIEQTDILKDKLEQDTKLLDVFKNEEAMLLKNQVVGGQSGVRASELKESLDLQRQRLTEVYAKELDIQKRIAFDQREYERMKSQLGEISKKKDSVSYTIYALVESKEPGSVIFKLSYNIKDAGWYPAYDVRVKEVTDPLHVMMNANIFQRSGETWKNISLFLSTGNPNDNATPSDLQPWMIGFYDPSFPIRGRVKAGTISGRITDENNQPVFGATITEKGFKTGTMTDENGFFKLQQVSNSDRIQISNVGYEPREVAVGTGYVAIALEHASTSLNDVVVMGYPASSDLEGAVSGVAVTGSSRKAKESMQTVSVTTQFQPTTTVYKIDDKYTLETDGKTTTIGIGEFEMPSLYDYYSVPKIDPSVFLTAKIINWHDYDLQSGEVSLYFEGTYLGKTYLDLGNATDTISLSLGKDNGIKVFRKLVKQYGSKKFIGSNRTETKAYEISVLNSKRIPVTIRLTDQFPVSTNKEIEIEDVKAQDALISKDTGMVSWTLPLQSGQEKKLAFEYSVKFPKDRQVVLE